MYVHLSFLLCRGACGQCREGGNVQVDGIRDSWFPGSHATKEGARPDGDRSEALALSRNPGMLGVGRRKRAVAARDERALSLPDWLLSVPVLRLLLVSGVTLLAALPVTFTVALLASRGTIYPQVQVLDVPVGGLSAQEAEDRVAARVATFVETPVTLTLGARVWMPTLAGVGLDLDIQGSVATGMRFGREDHRLAGLLQRARLTKEPFTVPLGIRFDDARFDAYLDGLETEVSIAPIDAALVVDGAQAHIRPGRHGLAIDRAHIRNQVLDQVRHLQPVSAELTLEAVPPVLSEEALVPAGESVERSLSEPMLLSVDDRQWSLDPQTLGGLVVVNRVTESGTGPKPVFSLDQAGLRGLLEGIVAEAEAEPSNARLDDSGSVPRLVPAVMGRHVDIDALAAAVQTAFQKGEHAIAVPVEETPPPVSTDAFLTELGITHFLASGDSDFAGSEPGREQNVRVAAELVDLTLVPPGGVFSYNHALGSIVEDPGFVPARATEGGIIGTSIGGGVCQVSTTVFRAALRAGLPIVEWWPHVHRSPFYEQAGWGPGLDASIAQPEFDPLNGSDFKFSNPTEAWMLVRAAVQDGTALTVELYGSPTGYSVEIDDPVIEWTEWASGSIEHVDPSLPPGTMVEDGPAQDGATVTVVRRVLDASGTLISVDEFVSAYQPHGTVYRVSPDMVGTT